MGGQAELNLAVAALLAALEPDLTRCCYCGETLTVDEYGFTVTRIKDHDLAWSGEELTTDCDWAPEAYGGNWRTHAAGYVNTKKAEDLQKLLKIAATAMKDLVPEAALETFNKLLPEWEGNHYSLLSASLDLNRND